RPPKPKPMPVREHWEIDFSPMASAGMVNLGINLTIRTADGGAHNLSVGQGGQVPIAPILDALAGGFQKEDLGIDPPKTPVAFRSMRGIPVISIEMSLRNLEQRYAPVVLAPSRVAPGKR